MDLAEHSGFMNIIEETTNQTESQRYILYQIKR